MGSARTEQASSFLMSTSFADAFNRVAKLQRPTKLRREHNKTLQLSDEQQRLGHAPHPTAAF